MKIIKTASEMIEWSTQQQSEGKKISFVPTMGALHEGHISLLRMGRNLGDKLVLSIFVNPTQFGANEDIEKYPRDLEGDLLKVKDIPVDCIFFPTNEIVYPRGYSTFVNVENISEHLCGLSRPTHFRGVATVVLKLFNIVAPQIAVFGEKDFQQLTIIKRMVADLNVPVEIISHPIVREKDGIAMSSRNAYLSKEERDAALSLSRSLKLAKKIILSGETSSEKIISAVKNEIESTRIPRVDYVKLVHSETLKDIPEFERPALLAVAAFVGKARLIDNIFWS